MKIKQVKAKDLILGMRIYFFENYQGTILYLDRVRFEAHKPEQIYIKTDLASRYFLLELDEKVKILN